MKTKSKILSAVVALLVAIIAAASSTYAWFTMNSKVTLDPFTVGVTAGNDTLLIAVTKVDGEEPKASDYKMTASLESIAKAIVESAGKTFNTNLTSKEQLEKQIKDAVELDALTTSITFGNLVNIIKKNTEDGRLDAFIKAFHYDNEGETDWTDDRKASIATNKEIEAAKLTSEERSKSIYKELTLVNSGNEKATTTSYISFDVHFQATKKMDIYLNDESTVTGDEKTQAGVTAWEEIKAETYAKNVTDVRTVDKTNASIDTTFAKDALLAINPANAVRIGFVSGETTNIWNPNFEQGFNKRSTTAVGGYNMNLAEAYNYAVSSGQNTPATNPIYLEDDKIGLYPAKLDDNNKNTVINGTTNNGYKSDSTVLATLVTKDNKSTAKITVKIWLEGNDGDCFNSIFSGDIITSLSFLAK